MTSRAPARLAAVLIVLGAWMIASWAFYSPRLALFPPPWDVAARFWQLVQIELPADIATSLGEAVGGWLIGSTAAIIVGTWIGRSPAAAFILRVAVDFLRCISPLAWVSLAIL